MQQAQQTILDAIKGVKGRGKSGLPEEQQEAFNAAVEVLEADGGLPVGEAGHGARLSPCQLVYSVRVTASCVEAESTT